MHYKYSLAPSLDFWPVCVAVLRSILLPISVHAVCEDLREDRESLDHRASFARIPAPDPTLFSLPFAQIASKPLKALMSQLPLLQSFNRGAFATTLQANISLFEVV